MFEYLKEYPYIIVTGPHRSGTTIIAHMIAYDTGKEFLDEANINHIYVRRIPDLFKEKRNIVLQAPYALPWASILSNSETAIVLVKRNISDIEKSAVQSKNKRGKKISRPAFSPKQAHELWSHIKRFIHNPFEVQYESVKDHPLWISKSERKGDWHCKQVDRSGNRYNSKNYAKKVKIGKNG